MTIAIKLMVSKWHRGVFFVHSLRPALHLRISNFFERALKVLYGHSWQKWQWQWLWQEVHTPGGRHTNVTKPFRIAKEKNNADNDLNLIRVGTVLLAIPCFREEVSYHIVSVFLVVFFNCPSMGRVTWLNVFCKCLEIEVSV